MLPDRESRLGGGDLGRIDAERVELVRHGNGIDSKRSSPHPNQKQLPMGSGARSDGDMRSGEHNPSIEMPFGEQGNRIERIERIERPERMEPPARMEHMEHMEHMDRSWRK